MSEALGPVVGKDGTYHLPFPILALAGTGGSVFLTAGGGGASASKEVPNVVQAHTYDEETGKFTTIASLNTGKRVVVRMSYSSEAGLWLASIGKGCMALKLDEEANQLTELCEWDTEAAGKEPEQNVAKFSPDAATIVTGGTDGILQLWKAGELKVPPTLLRKCGEKTKEIRDADFSGDGRFLACCDETGNVRLWDLEEDEQSKGVVISYTSSRFKVKLFTKFVTFVQGDDGKPALILSASGARGPAVVGMFGIDGVKLFEAVVDKAEPLKSTGLDAFCGRFVVGTVSGAKYVYSLPKLTLVKRGAPVHSLPSQAVMLLGANTAVSVSGDRSIHFLNCEGSTFCLSTFTLTVYLIAVLAAVLLLYFFLPPSLLELSPSQADEAKAALDAARKVARSVAEEFGEGEL